MPVDNLDGGMVGISYFGDMDLVNPVVVSPDAGGVYRCATVLIVLSSDLKVTPSIEFILVPSLTTTFTH